jgi:hypothetical protein
MEVPAKPSFAYVHWRVQLILLGVLFEYRVTNRTFG